MSWICCDFEQLSAGQLYDVLQLRAAVFVVEQNCPYQDLDDKDRDPQTKHLLHYNDAGQLLAYLRIMAPGVSYPEVAIGRVVTAAAGRGQGLGHELIDRGVTTARTRWPEQAIYLSAQAHLQDYYQRHGFTAVTAEYLEDGIPHVGMRAPA